MLCFNTLSKIEHKGFSIFELVRQKTQFDFEFLIFIFHFGPFSQTFFFLYIFQHFRKKKLCKKFEDVFLLSKSENRTIQRLLVLKQYENLGSV